MKRLNWNFESLVGKDNSWSGWFSSFVRTPNNEEQIKSLTEKHNQDLEKIEAEAPNLYKIMDDLLNKVTTEEQFFTVKIIPAKPVLTKVDHTIIDMAESSIDPNTHLISIENMGLFNIVQNIIYQLYVAQEYQNAAALDEVIDLDKVKTNYFNFIKNYFENNREELAKAFGINSEDLLKELSDYIASDSSNQEMVERKSNNLTEDVNKLYEAILSGVGEEMDAKEGEID